MNHPNGHSTGQGSLKLNGPHPTVKEADRWPRHDRRKPLFIVHDTDDGLIYLRTERQGRSWRAHNWGDQLEGGWRFRTMKEANEFLISSFGQMFPEHLQCTRRCRLNPYTPGQDVK